MPPGQGREPTGVWFAEQSADCLTAALEEFDRRAAAGEKSPARRQALRFNAQRFRAELFAYLDGVRAPAAAPLRRVA